ncbi:N-acyl-phosphatidylethanolamine-hydrolyzing phospholipase D [Paraphoma chrysanthemicola]|uniref:N-acyl-phosphatidylethanolamine-hydrolyzing phospholipase D n=1 Tax=Paraphoma chrysanthemicola TaxID=798071 RepID=A0A8K0QV92_9PLEO|nr:N-acyl-phosphatidylethanolamine-hydrolyzing phospholipase D [Paraphoma chrysanthemicola]
MSSIGTTAGSIAGLYAVVLQSEEEGKGKGVPDDVAEKKHHLKNGKGFRNPWDSYGDLTPWGFFWNTFWRKITRQQHHPNTTPPTVPVQTPSFLPTRATPNLRATWLGHACYYIEFPSGLRVLFDPVFEDCCAPVQIKSLKRYTPPPCEIEDLPVVDVVVISHSHYDHLSYPSVMRIKEKWPGVVFCVPLGLGKWFAGCGVREVVELDWWETRELRFESGKEGSGGSVTSSEGKGDAISATIGALPCQHVSARTPFDKNTTLWASWSVESGGSKVYFAGDTGYRTVPKLPPGTDDYSPAYAHLPHCPAFAEIGKHRGPFDLGLIPIGAYEPRYMFSGMHADPKDAVNIFVDTKCKRALGMHWGTWVLTEEDVLEPPRKLVEALRWKGVERVRERSGDGKEEEVEVFGVCDIGESREFESGVTEE